MSLLTKTLGLDPIQSSKRKDQQAALTNLGGLAPAYQTQATQGAATASQFLPQRNSAGQGLIDMLNRGYDGAGALKAKTLQRVGTGYDAAGARARLMASRTGASPAASLSLLDARRATDANNALTDYEQMKAQKDLEYRQMALQTAAGLGGSGLSEQNQGLGALGNLYNAQFSGYGNLAQQEEQAKAAAQQRLMQLIQSGASIAGGFAGAPAAPVMSGGRGVGGASYSLPESPQVTNAGMGTGGMGSLLMRRMRSGSLYNGGI